MRAGKDICRLVLILSAGLLCWGCQNGPDPRTVSRPRPKPAYPNGPAEGAVRAAAPLRITEPPAAVAQAPTPAPALPDLPTPGAVTPVSATAPAPRESDLRRLHRLAAEKYAGMDGYYVCLTRREQVNGKDGPKEVIRLMARKQPWSVRLVWLDGEGKGREVVYVKGRYEDKLHTRLGANDHKVIYGPGDHIALPLDSPWVRGSSRHGITEAGIGSLIEHFGEHVAANEKGDTRRGTLTCRGRQKRPEFAETVETVEQTIPAGAEKELPRGGRRLWMFDASADHLPALIITTDDAGHEVEYYRYEKYIPARLDDKDFDPTALWGK